MVTYQINEKKKVVHLRADSWAETLRWVDTVDCSQVEKDRAKNFLVRGEDDFTYGNTGLRSKDDARLRAGWHEGVKKIEKMGDAMVNVSGGAPAWRYVEEDGMAIDEERCIANVIYGEEMLFEKRRTRVIGNGKGKVVRIAVSIGENCSVKAEDIMCRCAAASRLCDLLEASGRRCEITAIWFSDGAFSGGYNATMAVQVKAADEPLNLAYMASALSPWALRMWGFMALVSMTPKGHASSSGLGQSRTYKDFKARDLLPQDSEYDFVADSGEALGPTWAKEWMEKCAAEA